MSISSQCAAAIDNLAAAYFKALNPDVGVNAAPGSEQLARHVASTPELLPDLLKTLFDIVLFEDCANQWSLSRPMLSLILVNEQRYGELKAQITMTMPPTKRGNMEACFEKLMNEVTRSLESRNRDSSRKTSRRLGTTQRRERRVDARRRRRHRRLVSRDDDRTTAFATSGTCERESNARSRCDTLPFPDD